MKMSNKHYTLAQSSKLFALIFTFFAGFSALIAQPANDNFCDATELTVGEFCVSSTNGDLTDSTLEPNEPVGDCYGFTPPTNSVWFSFVAPPSGLIMASANFPDLGTAVDAAMAIYELNGTNDCIIDSLVQVACNDSEVPSGAAERFPSIGTELTPGNTYYIQVIEQVFAPDPTVGGTFCIQIEELQAPPNDEVCDAIAIDLDADPVVFTNVGATSVLEFGLAPAPNPQDFLGTSSWGLSFGITRSIWFSFVAPASGMVDVDLSDRSVIGNYNSKIAVYAAADCNSVMGTNLIAAQSAFSEPSNAAGTASTFFFQNRIYELSCLTPGDTYFILVDGGNEVFFQPARDAGRGSIAIRTLANNPISAQTTVFDAACTGDSFGAIFAEGTGGAGDPLNLQGSQYTYEWSNGGTGRLVDSLTAGTYTVTITDLCGVTAVESYEVGENGTPSIYVSDDETINAGDEVELLAIGQGGNPTDIPRIYGTTNNGFGPPSGRVLQMDLRTEEVPTTVAGDTLPTFSQIAYANDKLYSITNISNFPAPTTYELWETDIASGLASMVAAIDFPADESPVDMQYNLYTNQLWAMTDASKMYVIDVTTAAATFAFDVPVILPNDFVIVDETTILVSDADEINSLTTNLFLIDLPSNTILNTAIVPVIPGQNDMSIDPGTPDVYFYFRYLSTASLVSRQYHRFDLNTGEFSPVKYVSQSIPNIIDFTIAPRTVEGYTYEWNPATTLDDANSPNPVASPTETTTYTVTATDACGTSTANSVTITVAGNEADLELNITSSLTEYKIWEIVPYQITLTNNGTADATNVKVAAGLPSGMVYTSHNVVTGNYNDYNLFFEEWTVPNLAAGETAVLDLVLFPLVQNVDLTNFVQVLQSDQLDPDSTPGNDTDNTPDEDDEAAVTLSNANPIAPLVANGGTSTGNAVLYPTPATDVLNVAFESATAQPQVMRIYDVLGRAVIEQDVDVYEGFNQVTFEVNGLQSGTYFVWMGAEAELMKFVK